MAHTTKRPSTADAPVPLDPTTLEKDLALIADIQKALERERAAFSAPPATEGLTAEVESRLRVRLGLLPTQFWAFKSEVAALLAEIDRLRAGGWSAAPTDRYTVTADTVLDNRTGLMWQREVPSERYTWAEAKAYAAELRLGGHKDWRLPTIEELESLVVRLDGAPTIDRVAFPDTPAEFFWSSSPNADDTSYAWGVNFNYGYTNDIGTTNDYRVRCVR